MRFFLLALFLTLIVPPVAFGSSRTTGDKTVTVEGCGTNKQNALLQAKRSAVEEGIGIVLTSETEVKNFTIKKDKIITHSFGAVKSYKLLKSQQQGENWYVQIKAVVSLDSIKADLIALKILLVSMDKPRTMVLIKEEGGKNAETSIIDYLQGKGFELIDPVQAATLMNKKDPFIQKAINGAPLAAAKLGAENGAEYIIVGSVRKTLLKSDFLTQSGMQSGQASLTVKVVNCSSGRIVATKSATGAAVHISDDIAKSQAAAKAAANLMDKTLFEAIVSSFQDTINNGANFDVIITTVNSYRDQKKTSGVLENIDGVVSVTKRSFGKGKLDLSILFKGSVDTFCDRVDNSIIGGKKLLVTDVVGNRIVLSLQNQ